MPYISDPECGDVSPTLLIPFSRSASESRELDTNVLNSSLRFVSPALRPFIELLLHDATEDRLQPKC